MNLNELDEPSKSFFDLLNQSMNQRLTFEQVKKGLIRTSPLEGIKTHQTARQISNEIALESPFGKKSLFYREKDGYFLSLHVNKKGLVDDVIELSNKKGILKYSEFLYSGFGNSSGFIIDSVLYDVKVEVNVLSGTVDLNKNPIFRFNYNVKEQKAEFKILYEFEKFKDSKDNNRIAFIFSFNKYVDLEVLLNKLGKQLVEETKKSILKEFDKAFIFAKGKSEVLDFVYETAPDFVLISRDVKALYEDLQLLSTKKIDSVGTNENISITNIIDAINKKDIYDKNWFFNEVNKNPETIRVLFEKLNKKYVEKLIFLTASIGHNLWKKEDLKKAWDYIIDYSEFKTIETKEKNYYDPYVLYTGFAYYNENKKRYKIGTAIFRYNSNNSLLPDENREIGPEDLKLPFEPMRLKLEKGDLYIPCFVAEYFTNKKIDEEWWTILNNFVPLLLIETTAAIRGANVISKLFSNGKKIKTVDQLILFLDKVDESVLAVDLEKVGIEVLFRGTTRNIQGELFTGNTNSILNGTSTSTDPIRGVIYGIESATEFKQKGFLQVFIPKDLKGLNLQAPNRRIAIELEIIVKTSPKDLSKYAVIEVPIEEARQIVNKLYNVKIPKSIYINDFENGTYYLNETKKITPKQAIEFYKEVIKLNNK